MIMAWDGAAGLGDARVGFPGLQGKRGQGAWKR